MKHDRHFTFKNIQSDLAITFVTPSVSGSSVTREQPYALLGPWLQVLIVKEDIDLMLSELDDVSDLEKVLFLDLNCTIGDNLSHILFLLGRTALHLPLAK